MHFKKKTLASSENLEQQSFMQKILTIFWRTTKRKRLKPYFCKNCNPINHFLAFKLEKSTLQLLSKLHSPITHFVLLFWSKCKKIREQIFHFYFKFVNFLYKLGFVHTWQHAISDNFHNIIFTLFNAWRTFVMWSEKTKIPPTMTTTWFINEPLFIWINFFGLRKLRKNISK